MTPFDRLLDMVTRDGRAALVSLVEARGSAPREIGARMAVAVDGTFSGTIGGGALEWQALAEAQAMLAHPTQKTLRTFDKSLGPDLGQCCGGRVRLTIERFERDDLAWLTPLAEAGQPVETIGSPQPGGHYDRRPASAAQAAMLAPSAAWLVLPDGRLLERFGLTATPLLLFGAGHVGRALVLALAPLPFSITWIDSRPDAFPRHIPQNVATSCAVEPVLALAQAPQGAIILVMTHSHALDLEIATAALRTSRFPLVGVIGSATKRARFASQMRQAGLDKERIAELVCPIGITGIASKQPAVIAASVVAQALIMRERIDAKRSGQQAQGRDLASQASTHRL
jgi:xanthine dehydrogenase accessory factor